MSIRLDSNDFTTASWAIDVVALTIDIPLAIAAWKVITQLSAQQKHRIEAKT